MTVLGHPLAEEMPYTPSAGCDKLNITINKLWTDLPALVITQKTHDEHVLSYFHRLRASDTSHNQPFKIAHFLLGPKSHHLTGVATTVSPAETIFSSHVTIAIFEDEDGCFIDLES